MNILSIAQNGIFEPSVSSTILHAAMGAFFAASGWNKLTNKARHKAFTDTLAKDHVPALKFNQWWVPGWEFAGGLGLAFGMLPAFCAAVLLVICLVATRAEGAANVAAYHPINKVDVVADWLYLPEVLYCVTLMAIVLGA